MASDEGAETAAITGRRAASAFCTISKEMRPEIMSTWPTSGTRSRSQRPADHLVDGIVAADVLAHHEERAVGRDQRGGMQAAGAGEHRLGGHQAIHQAAEEGGRETRRVVQRRRRGEGVLDRRLAAHAAARAGEEVAAQRLEVDGDAVAQGDADDIVFRGGVGHDGAVADGDDVGGALDDPLRHQKAARQLAVVAGRAHDHRQRGAVQLDLERLLAGNQIAVGYRVVVVVAQELDGLRGIVVVLHGARLPQRRAADNDP